MIYYESRADSPSPLTPEGEGDMLPRVATDEGASEPVQQQISVRA